MLPVNIEKRLLSVRLQWRSTVVILFSRSAQHEESKSYIHTSWRAIPPHQQRQTSTAVSICRSPSSAILAQSRLNVTGTNVKTEYDCRLNIAILYRFKKLSYCRGTAQRSLLVNSCYMLREIGDRKVSNSKSDLQGHPRAQGIGNGATP